LLCIIRTVFLILLTVQALLEPIEANYIFEWVQIICQLQVESKDDQGITNSWKFNQTSVIQ